MHTDVFFHLHRCSSYGKLVVDVFICNLCRKCSSWYRQRCSRDMLCGLVQDLFLTVMLIFAESRRTCSSIFILHQPKTQPTYSVSSYESDLATLEAQRDHAMKIKVISNTENKPQAVKLAGLKLGQDPSISLSSPSIPLPMIMTINGG